MTKESSCPDTELAVEQLKGVLQIVNEKRRRQRAHYEQMQLANSRIRSEAEAAIRTLISKPLYVRSKGALLGEVSLVLRLGADDFIGAAFGEWMDMSAYKSYFDVSDDNEADYKAEILFESLQALVEADFFHTDREWPFEPFERIYVPPEEKKLNADAPTQLLVTP